MHQVEDQPRLYYDARSTNHKKKVQKVGIIPSASEKGKVKEIPLQAWTGPETSRSLRLPHFKTIGT